MRAPLGLSVLLLVLAAPLTAQDPNPKPPLSPFKEPAVHAPQLPATPVLETIAVTTFAIVQPNQGVVLKATFSGLKPLEYQISKFPDFHDATWLAWPASNAPAWDGGQTSQTCGQFAFFVVGHFRARARRSGTLSTLTTSNTMLDTLCRVFG